MAFSISSSYTKLRNLVESASKDTLPAPGLIQNAVNKLPPSLPTAGLGEDATATHLLSDIAPGFNGPKTSANYYGFVTGGVFPIAEVADNIVTAFDQNVQVHLPDQSVSTFVEDKALSMLIDLLNLGEGWDGKIFTTGATSANILGLACGREVILQKRLQALGITESVGELGILAACMKAGVKDIQVVTTMGHSSLFKAASVVGLGRASVKEIPYSDAEPWKLDLSALKAELERENEGIVSIVAISAGEVNTGRFAIDGSETMNKIRELCDKHGAWLHVDGAFGVFARSLPEGKEFATLINSAAGIELADSITGDGHKMLNVPYDCGFFFTRSSETLSSVFGNPNAAYLAAEKASIISPLNHGLENSRRLRALPVYAALLAYGRVGYAEMFARQVRLARGIAEFLEAHDGYELLAQERNRGSLVTDRIHIIVIFRAKDETISGELGKRINETRKMYVSGTKWEGRPASRIAISTWKVEVERDLTLVTGILEKVLQSS